MMTTIAIATTQPPGPPLLRRIDPALMHEGTGFHSRSLSILEPYGTVHYTFRDFRLAHLRPKGPETREPRRGRPASCACGSAAGTARELRRARVGFLGCTAGVTSQRPPPILSRPLSATARAYLCSGLLGSCCCVDKEGTRSCCQCLWIQSQF